MERCFEVGVYGRNMFFIEIEDVLRKRKQLRVRWLGNSLLEVLWEIRMLSPHVILFEMDGSSQGGIAALMEQCHGIKFIGIEPGRDAVQVISAHEKMISSDDSLARVILKSLSHCQEQPGSFH